MSGKYKMLIAFDFYPLVDSHCKNRTLLHYLINVSVNTAANSKDSFLSVFTSLSQMTGTAFFGEVHVLTFHGYENKNNCHGFIYLFIYLEIG